MCAGKDWHCVRGRLLLNEAAGVVLSLANGATERGVHPLGGLVASASPSVAHTVCGSQWCGPWEL